jgi:hypothetical protein
MGVGEELGAKWIQNQELLVYATCRKVRSR